VVGGTKAKDRDTGFDARILLSTYHYASEGIDIPRLDTLVMATPRGNIEQTVGRILRPHPFKQQPLVVDVKDPFSLFTGMAWKRHAYYKSQKYYVTRELDVGEQEEQEEVNVEESRPIQSRTFS
jgi:superfamily II DNA or RNA helicase